MASTGLSPARDSTRRRSARALLARTRELSDHELSTAAQWADSRRVRDVLAARASAGRYDFLELVSLAHEASLSGSSPRLTPSAAESRALVELARLVIQQAWNDSEFADAAALYELSTPTGRTLPDAEQHHYATALLASAQHAKAVRVARSWPSRDHDRRQFVVDALNPHHSSEETPSRDLWLHAFNDAFASVGLEPPRHDASALVEHEFDRLVAPPVGFVDGPLVSVIMSCYRPGPEIRTAVASILAQSWRNLELLVVDDGSPAEFASLLDELEALDGRVRVIRRETNRGTYVCRNAGLDLARGEFVTMHDSDDWAHPRRLETQAGHLLATPDAPSNSTFALRVTDTLSLFQPRGRDIKLCEPSLMFRRERVMRRIGYFDAVMKGADSEFRRRISSAFDRESDLVRPDAPLTLQRYRRSSLTGEEIRPRWMHDSRIAYASAYRLWHATIAQQDASPYLDRDQQPRPFPAPREMIRGSEAAPARFDTIVALDFVERERDRRDFTEVERRIRELAASGQRVGLAHLWSVGPKPLAPVHFAPRLQALVAEGLATQVLLGTEAEADRLLLPDASVLQHADPTPLPWRVGTVVAEAWMPRPLRHRRRAPLDQRVCADAAHALFGVELEWPRRR
ncbi:glycosyltransferase family 2 protein [Compostimonas suwonensis]|uniref:glycosyltransferase family 2 protein n=1 Tax=Compostimonas suwonensis TaxID=1048394 RepID=UPI0012FDCFDE|nr:glycosyltransferase family A protein [Compostimonas suwonensis]